MEFSDIVAVSGKPGLFKILKPTRTGVILESLDDSRKKLVATGNHRVSALNEISIYTTDTEGSKPLEDIMIRINEEFEDDLGLDKTSTTEEYESFLRHILPDYDPVRVYPSDIKRLVSWYNVILKEAPELLSKKDENEGENQ